MTLPLHTAKYKVEELNLIMRLKRTLVSWWMLRLKLQPREG